MMRRYLRRSIRLQGYDYSGPGSYFVSICVQHRECLFGDVIRGNVHLNQAGTFIEWWWQDIPKRFPNVALDEFVVMPNHLQGILTLCSEEGTHGGVPLHKSGRAPKLGDVVGWFKSITTTDYTRGAERLDWPRFHQRLSQRNYFEQIIRNEAHLDRIRSYIVENSAKWHLDDDHPSQIPAIEYRS